VEENLGTRVRIMLVEDHPDFRFLMAALLDQEADLEVVAQAGSLAEARSQAAAVGHDVAVLDLELPDGNGAELIGELRDANDGVGVLVLSASLDLGNPRRATEAGADEILDKLTPSEEVVEAIRRLGAGGTPDRQEE
jgi:DNA-binding NarL/FixJ family response regulator